jgi:phosphatidylglycerol---prolipoprotein diacylglyceryl transferase
MIAFIIWDIDPRIFNDIEFLRWYGLSWAVGMIGRYQVLLRIYKHEGISLSSLEPLATYVMLGAIIGGRLGHVLFYDPVHYLHNPIEILPFQIEPTFQFTGLAGLASHGGVLGALFALYLYSKKHQTHFLWTLDRLTIAASLLGGFIRLGNLMNSEIIGIPTKVPWAFVFTWVDHLPRHPTQLYEALCYFAIFSILFVLWKSGKVQNHKGFLFGFGLSLIFAQRFLMEYWKKNQVAFEENLLFNMGQMLSLPLIAAGILIMVRSFKKNADKQ